MNKRTLLPLLVLAAMLAAPAGASALTVYAASSLASAFPEIQRNATFSFGGSNTLQAQIERGAPADVFASASPKEALALYHEGRCSRPVTFATNRLVILVPKGNPSGVTSAYALRNGKRRLAIGTAGVPIGVYTRQVLSRMRLSSILSSNTVSQETNVTSVATKVALGSADAGFVYVTDARAFADRTDTVALPKWAQPAVRYETCVVQRNGVDSAGAQAFIARLRSGLGRAVLKRFGFGLPPRG
jgi:molybdate transport system substrate-binding protein